MLGTKSKVGEAKIPWSPRRTRRSTARRQRVGVACRVQLGAPVFAIRGPRIPRDVAFTLHGCARWFRTMSCLKLSGLLNVKTCSVGLTDLTLSCAARAHVPKPSGATAASVHAAVSGVRVMSAGVPPATLDFAPGASAPDRRLAAPASACR